MESISGEVEVKECVELALSICKNYETQGRWLGYLKLEEKMKKAGVSAEMARLAVKELRESRFIKISKKLYDSKDSRKIRPLILTSSGRMKIGVQETLDTLALTLLI